jgi:mRNA-degrading endonuclease RelE of RelBE toxin-antitoxin system
VERYKILLKANVVHEYEAIYSKVERRRVLGKIAALSGDPRPAEATKLPERVDQLRICLVNFRLIYEINDRKKQVTIFRIAHRRSQGSAW